MHRVYTVALCLSFSIFIHSGAVFAGVIFNSANGHYYDRIPGAISWGAANTAANAMSYNGVAGHLVTVTSAAENKFLTDSYGGAAIDMFWIGGYQPAGSTEPAGGWSWVTGEAFVYNNWFPPSEPNNYGNQDSIMFAHLVLADGKAWDDFIGTNNGAGYIVEFDTPLSPPAAVPEPGDWIAALSVIVVCFLRRISLGWWHFGVAKGI